MIRRKIGANDLAGKAVRKSRAKKLGDVSRWTKRPVNSSVASADWGIEPDSPRPPLNTANDLSRSQPSLHQSIPLSGLALVYPCVHPSRFDPKVVLTGQPSGARKQGPAPPTPQRGRSEPSPSTEPERSSLKGEPTTVSSSIGDRGSFYGRGAAKASQVIHWFWFLFGTVWIFVISVRSFYFVNEICFRFPTNLEIEPRNRPGQHFCHRHSR